MEDENASKQRSNKPNHSLCNIKDHRRETEFESEQQHSRCRDNASTAVVVEAKPHSVPFNGYSAFKNNHDKLRAHLFLNPAAIFGGKAAPKGLSFSKYPSLSQIPRGGTNIICFGVIFDEDYYDDVEPPPIFSIEQRRARDRLLIQQRLATMRDTIHLQERRPTPQEFSTMLNLELDICSLTEASERDVFTANSSYLRYRDFQHYLSDHRSDAALQRVDPHSPASTDAPVDPLSSTASPLDTGSLLPSAFMSVHTTSQHTSDNIRSNTSSDSSTGVVGSAAHSSGTDSSLDSVGRQKYNQQMKNKKLKEKKGKLGFLSCFGGGERS
jgi:hypothetical protein